MEMMMHPLNKASSMLCVFCLSHAHTHAHSLSRGWHPTEQNNAARHGSSHNGTARGTALPVRSPCGTVLYATILY